MMRRLNWGRSSRGVSRNALRSPPAMNARPLPESIKTRMLLSATRRTQSCSNCSAMATFRAFSASGRLNRTSIMPSRGEVSMSSATAATHGRNFTGVETQQTGRIASVHRLSIKSGHCQAIQSLTKGADGPIRRKRKIRPKQNVIRIRQLAQRAEGGDSRRESRVVVKRSHPHERIPKLLDQTRHHRERERDPWSQTWQCPAGVGKDEA